MPILKGTNFADDLDQGNIDNSKINQPTLAYGYGGNDYVSGGHGNDSLYGGSGDDVISGFRGTDIIDGGTGFDMYVTGCSSATPPTEANYIYLGNSNSFQDTGCNGRKLFISIEWINISSGDALVYGTDTSESFIGATGEASLNWIGDDHFKAFRGADTLIGNGGNDTLRAGNGKDLISGGAGADDLYGGFGQNTFENERDGSFDELYIKSDHLAVNQLNGKAGNNTGNKKADIIKSLDPTDEINIQGAKDSQLTFGATTHVDATGRPIKGIGIFASDSLEAIYIGGNLTIDQLIEMTWATP
ncbi:hypothetical protein [Synechococcus sp. MIT S1220]|uniref:hypothetical protein n=1 Tax=Synechococcus sp. MIT S1220 TaxID=3082549 RepID=UPI0039AF4773